MHHTACQPLVSIVTVMCVLGLLNTMSFAQQDRGQRPDRQPQRPREAPHQQQPIAAEVVALVPVTELSGDVRYKGEAGGLYGDGRNDPPAAHLEAALARARQIQPLDERGDPSAEGVVVLLSVGMSNTTQSYQRFMQLAQQDAQLSPRLRLVDGAQGGQDAADWGDPANRHRRDRPDAWQNLHDRLRQASVTSQQVQVVWLKQARRQPHRLGEFPDHARAVQQDLAAIVQRLGRELPNLKLVYLSSRTFAGYARNQLNPEPYAYESAFAVRWLIEQQMAGSPELNHDASAGEVKSPLLLWGPYLWAPGDRPRADGLQWHREDFAGDGVHPSGPGRDKVGNQLLRFFKTDPTARPWALADAVD